MKIIIGFTLSFLLVIFSMSNLHSQPKIDSLSVLLEQALNDETKIDLLNEISWTYTRTDMKKSEEFARVAVAFADSVGYKGGHAEALNLLSMSLPLEESFEINKKALELALEADDKYQIAVIYTDLGGIYWEQGNTDLALENYLLSLKVAKEINDPLTLCYSQSSIGSLYYEMGNDSLAIVYYKNAGESGLLSTEHTVQATAYENLSYVSELTGNLDEAIYYQKKGITIAREGFERNSVVYGLMNLSQLQSQKGFFEAAEKSYKEAIVEAEILGDKYSLNTAYQYLSYIYIQQEEYNQAIKAAKKSLEYVDELGLSDSRSVLYRNLATAYSATSNHKEAYRYLTDYYAIRDSMYDEEAKQNIAQLETEYQAQQKEAENQLLKAEQAKLRADNKVRVRNILAITISLILLSSLYLIYLLLKSRKALSIQKEILEKTNNDLVRSNKELEQFAYVASHDLQEPLRMVGNFVQLLEVELDEKMNDEERTYVNYIVSGVTRMSQLIDDLLKYSKVGMKDMVMEATNPLDIINNKVFDLMIKIKDSNADIVINELPKTINCVPNQLGIVFYNLINNALKFNKSEKPIVTIDYTDNHTEYIFSIKDNGIGIDPANHAKIFDIFKRLHRKEIYPGTGIGLALVKRIILKHKGDIWVESSLGQGTTFFFSIPK